MIRFVRNAMSDIRSNRFMNFITIITIALSILMVSLFLLFFENTGRAIEAWNQGGRAVVYLSDGFDPAQLPELKSQIQALGGVDEMRFLPKAQALAKLKVEMAGQTTFLESLERNPLPHALEIRMARHGELEQMAELAHGISALEWVDSVEYGQGWLGKFLRVFNLFKATGYVICSLFLLIALFITSNTVRLAFHSRQTEVEIMRLVGATEGFIKAPFYVEGLLQGFFGGLLGLMILLSAYTTLASGVGHALASYVYLDIRFLSVKAMALVIVTSTFLGWFGCYLSLKQILK